MNAHSPIQLFKSYQKKCLRPALLESQGFCSQSRRSVLGIHPRQSLIAQKGVLYLNEKPVGHPKDIFQYLSLHPSSRFFPAWIGFFGYEFARNFDLPTKESWDELPDAAFFLYDEGYRWENDILVEAPQSPLENTQETPGLIHPVTLHSDFDKTDFLQAARIVQEKIRAGDVYQVNIAQRFYFDKSNLDPISIYTHLVKSNPSPFMGLIANQNWSLISGSPERLFRYHHGTIITRPIAGTRPRGKTSAEDHALQEELFHDRKERAEHAMLVDLLRNDLAKVSKPGSIDVSEAFTVEYYSHVMHLVSEVKSQSDASLENVFQAIFPGGTITGTPKESAMQTIQELEPVPRGPYTGSLGYISSGYGADFNILIRSIVLGKNHGYFSTGAGIVIESDPEKEYQEIQQKAQSLRHVLKCGHEGYLTKTPLISSKWTPKFVKNDYPAQVAFIENHDSFSFNIIDYLRCLGCHVTIFDHHQDPDLNQCTHVVIGPGPKEPHSAGKLMDWLSQTIHKNLPLLGICLGHQAIGLSFGAKLIRAPRPVHGETQFIQHQQQGLFHNLKLNLQATRYHSLVLADIPETLEVHAHSLDNQIMAIAHKTKPIFGIQFHPESFLSTQGSLILKNFLEITHVKTIN